MDKVQILVYAIASFFTIENPLILAKSAEIEINLITKQIVLHQYDIVTIPQYSEKAVLALNELLRAQTFVEDLDPLMLTSKHVYEKDGKLNASIYIQFKEMSDLRAISIHFDAEKNTLSYPFMKEFEYSTANAIFDERYLRLKANSAIYFGMSMKETPELKNTLSLLSEWKKIEGDTYLDVSEIFSKKDFKKLRKFIFKNGDLRTFRNFDTNNPHYRFEDFDVYLGTGDQRSVFKNDTLKPKDFSELVIGFPNDFVLNLAPHTKIHEPILNLEDEKVYAMKCTAEKMDELKERLSIIKRAIN